MAMHSETLTRDRPPQKVLIGSRISRAQLAPLLDAHTRFQAGRADGRRAVLLRCDLRGLDLRGIDLSGADLVHCDFEGSNLTRPRFEGSTLTGFRFATAFRTADSFSGPYSSAPVTQLHTLRPTDPHRTHLA